MSLLELAAGLAEPAPYGGKTLLQRATGRFYTPTHLADDLASRIVANYAERAARSARAISICDPFCGDGRLVASVLEVIANHPELRRRQLVVRLYDVEAAAVEAAATIIRDRSANLGLELKFEVRVGDSFEAVARLPPSDIVVTNPPWEHLKPDRREMNALSPSEQSRYRDLLRHRSHALDDAFPNSTARRQWAGWGTNLARCGWELSLGICRAGGTVGIVLPATLFADQASEGLRTFAFTHHELDSVSVYPAEARLFSKVDQAVVTAVSTHSRPKNGAQTFTLRTYGSDLSLAGDLRCARSAQQLATNGYALPVGFGATADHVAMKFAHLSSLGELETEHPHALWAGREVDETRMLEKVVSGSRHPFVKGKMIERHRVRLQPSVSVRSEFVPSRSVSHERIVWRDVSRATQARRMIGTIIPANWVAGNSLHVAFFKDDNRVRLRALYALISSYVVEFQVRTRLATGHVSLGAVRAARIPELSPLVEKNLARAGDWALRGQGNELLEVTVAKAFGLERDEFADLLACFPKTSTSEREALLSMELWAAAAE